MASATSQPMNGQVPDRALGHAAEERPECEREWPLLRRTRNAALGGPRRDRHAEYALSAGCAGVDGRVAALFRGAAQREGLPSALGLAARSACHSSYRLRGCIVPAWTGFPLRLIDARPISEDLLMIRVSRLALLTLLSRSSKGADSGRRLENTTRPRSSIASVRLLLREVYALALNTPFATSQNCSRRRRHCLVCGRDNAPRKATECRDHAVLRRRPDDDRRPIGELE